MNRVFKRHGLRCTRPRAQIYLALASTTAHPTADELFHAVRGTMPGVSLATVYNALDAFCRRGMARKIVGLAPEDDAARYDADLSEHAHFIADSGQVRDVPADLSKQVVAALPPDLIEDVERRMGVRIDRVNIAFLGGNTGGGGC